jgi:hypothetical protein
VALPGSRRRRRQRPVSAGHEVLGDRRNRAPDRSPPASQRRRGSRRADAGSGVRIDRLLRWARVPDAARGPYPFKRPAGERLRHAVLRGRHLSAQRKGDRGLPAGRRASRQRGCELPALRAPAGARAGQCRLPGPGRRREYSRRPGPHRADVGLREPGSARRSARRRCGVLARADPGVPAGQRNPAHRGIQPGGRYPARF